MKHFRFSFIFTLICLVLAACWGFTHGTDAGVGFMLKCLFITMVLAVMEVSLSFDNAVVNASILKHWSPFWQKVFLTVGIVVAVFGMRLVFPILVVAFSAQIEIMSVIELALNNPAEYSRHLTDNYPVLAAFGGTFLMLVGLSYFLDGEKDNHWLKGEALYSSLAEKITHLHYVVVALIVGAVYVAIVRANNMAWDSGFPELKAAVTAILIYAGVQMLCGLLEKFTGDDEDEGHANGQALNSVAKGGIAGFLYLELLDASFSFDGVIGAFAISQDVVIIMLGLAIGAMFVRSMTVFLVERGTLNEYEYLEHGAQYAIVALAIIMLLGSVGIHIPEVFTGLVGAGMIGLAFWCSVKKNRVVDENV